MALAGFAIQAVLLVGIVWVVDFAIEQLRKSMTASAS